MLPWLSFATELAVLIEWWDHCWFYKCVRCTVNVMIWLRVNMCCCVMQRQNIPFQNWDHGRWACPGLVAVRGESHVTTSGLQCHCCSDWIKIVGRENTADTHSLSFVETICVPLSACELPRQIWPGSSCDLSLRHFIFTTFRSMWCSYFERRDRLYCLQASFADAVWLVPPSSELVSGFQYLTSWSKMCVAQTPSKIF